MDPQPLSTIKVFFALWPTAEAQSRLVAWQQALQQLCGGRAMRGETLHSTLLFIGEVAPSSVETLRLAAQQVRAESFELCFDAARYWGHNHIVYAAPGTVPTQLGRLYDALEQALARQHLRFEQRAYQPHVTLLRNAEWSDAPLPGMHPVCWQVREFVLVQSRCPDNPSGYGVLARFPLQ